MSKKPGADCMFPRKTLTRSPRRSSFLRRTPSAPVRWARRAVTWSTPTITPRDTPTICTSFLSRYKQEYKNCLTEIMRMERKTSIEKAPDLKKDDLIVITGAGGFIGGNLAKYFFDKGFTRIRAADKKPLHE